MKNKIKCGRFGLVLNLITRFYNQNKKFKFGLDMNPPPIPSLTFKAPKPSI